jgi:hypothetical protein
MVIRTITGSKPAWTCHVTVPLFVDEQTADEFKNLLLIAI